MKNLIILALTSMLLFSVSAGLSMWLKQSKEEAAKPEAKKDEPKKDADKEKKAEKDDHGKPADKGDHAKPAEKGHGPETSHADTGDLARSREREEKLQKRLEQIEIVLQDAREQREVQDKLSKQVATETKATLERNIELDNRASTLQKQRDELEKSVAEVKKTPLPADLKKAQAEADAAEAKNLEKVASVVEAMPTDKAALQLQEMANDGKLETVVKVLGKMKERQTAKILAEIPDIALAGQLLDKMRSTKRPAPAPEAAGH
ncbi:MotE family protein [Limnoglobus roseus]|uniref:Magnesium transporter MgtE intracellular domain-containing protein n=1 Tax=Limnoglobus roseus TaxID=2598579 RepID=A0A5C1A862_9BACT|nr:hypothetical protein [Limnoglobus roseus]QEL13324.1 hypothetical protein PX52LOC_00178 [Limnoglobus roseus]